MPTIPGNIFRHETDENLSRTGALLVWMRNDNRRPNIMYNKVNTDMNFVEREKEVEKFWKENDTFRKSMERRKDGPTYTFYDGPPTANGKPHIGHVLLSLIHIL